MIQDYKLASSIEEAVELNKTGYVILAGGTQVNRTPFMKHGHRPEKVVSIAGLELAGISREGNEFLIGAGTTLQDIADSYLVPDVLRRAAGFIPSRSVRNIATIGGNVGAKRPDSYLIPTLMALGAVAETVAGPVPVHEYVDGDNESLIIRFRIPPLEGLCRAVKESRSHQALPVVSAAAWMRAEGGAVKEAVVAAGCVAPRTLRLTEIEEGIISGKLPGSGQTLEVAVAGAIHPEEDILGSREYKTYINSVLIADLVRGLAVEVLK
jgi:putative selenate reductase FAD-binding subunit